MKQCEIDIFSDNTKFGNKMESIYLDLKIFNLCAQSTLSLIIIDQESHLILHQLPRNIVKNINNNNTPSIGRIQPGCLLEAQRQAF